MPNIFFVLASGSPRRREFMALLETPFVAVVPMQTDSISNTATEIDETPLPDESPPMLVQRLSRLKAQAVLTMLPSLEFSTPHLSGRQPVVIAADTVVALDDHILGKPQNPAEATQMLTALRQACHQVYTGFTIAAPARTAAALTLSPAQPAQDLLVTRLHQSTVWMRAYTDQEIEAYVASGDPLDKAGAYAIQSETFSPVSRLEGCFASVMGLPLDDLVTALNDLKIAMPPIGPICGRFTGQVCCSEE